MQPAGPELYADPTQLGRLLSLLERGGSAADELLASLPPPDLAAESQVIGLTGSPGVGKSTLAGRLIEELLRRGEKVAVLAVDPTSPLSGGAVLGDRVRMQQAGEDGRLFIRSLGSRGSLGGLSGASFGSTRLLQAAGFTRIIIETVGVGQTGDDVSGLADCVVVLLSPEGGDGLQMIKAGLLELGDIFVVNKSDRPGAEAMLSELLFSIGLSHSDSSVAGAEWQPPVLATSASEGSGIAELCEALEAQRVWLSALPADHPVRQQRLLRRLRMRLRALVAPQLEQALRELGPELAARISAGELTEDSALEQLGRELGRRLG